MSLDRYGFKPQLHWCAEAYDRRAVILVVEMLLILRFKISSYVAELEGGNSDTKTDDRKCNDQPQH